MVGPQRTQRPRASGSLGDAPYPDSSSGARLLSAEDRQAMRRAGGRSKSRSSHAETEVVPQCLELYRQRFPGREGLLTELARYRESPPSELAVTPAVRRCVANLANGGALMRLVRLRGVHRCEHCRTLRHPPPFCAVPLLDVQPVGSRQHRNAAAARSCVVKRAFNAITLTRARLLSFLADEHGRLRLWRDTDDQGGRMHMLPRYLRALWSGAHHLGLAELLDAVQSAWTQHGLPPPSHEQTTAIRELGERFGELRRSALDRGEDGPLGPSPCEAVETLAVLHAALFGADYADYAMQAVLVVLDHRTHQAARAGARLEPPPPPPSGWLVVEAEALHASYPPETYVCADGSAVTVSRDHSHAQRLLDAWRRNNDDVPHHDDQAPSSGPGSSASRRRSRPRPRNHRRLERDEHHDDHEDDEEDEEDEEEEEDDDDDEIVPVPAKRARLHMRLASSSSGSSSASPDPIAAWLEGQDEARSSLGEADEEEPYTPASDPDPFGPLEAYDGAGMDDEEPHGALAASANARCDAEVQCDLAPAPAILAAPAAAALGELEDGMVGGVVVLMLMLMLVFAVVVLLPRAAWDDWDEAAHHTRAGFDYVARLLAHPPPFP